MKLKRKASKRKNEPARETTSLLKKKKKQRTKLARKLRSPISPVQLLSKANPNPSEEDNSSTCTHLRDERSSVTIPQRDKNKRPRDEKHDEKEENDAPSRRNTRSNSKKRNEAEVSLITQNDDVVSFASNSAAESCLSSLKTVEKKQLETDLLSREASTKNNRKNDDDVVSDLACGEKLVEDKEDDDVVSDYNCLCDDYYCSSSLDPSDYTPSLFLDSSGSDFSTGGGGDDSPPSRTFSILVEFRSQFCWSTSSFAFDARRSLVYQSESRFVRFENKEDEEAYERLRERERRQVICYDYGELYRSTTDYGDLIVEQRCLMVHWIAEHSEQLQPETLFLAISILDRFLSKGFFKTKRNLQIAGIACLTLATRIEENQPHNSVRRKSFRIGSDVYNRYEVVAMEWLVQEVLNFQCFLPTVYNFLWFYLKAAGADPVLEKRAKYLAVLAISDHEQLGHWPSTVAAAIVILASLQSNQIAIYQRVIEIHVRTKENDLHESIKSLEWLLQFAT